LAAESKEPIHIQCRRCMVVQLWIWTAFNSEQNALTK